MMADTQTSITGGLAGAISGVLANRLGDFANQQAGMDSDSVGNIALSFVINALATSAVYIAVSQVMPASASNVTFSYMFFVANTGLTYSALSLANTAVDMVLPR